MSQELRVIKSQVKSASRLTSHGGLCLKNSEEKEAEQPWNEGRSYEGGIFVFRPFLISILSVCLSLFSFLPSSLAKCVEYNVVSRAHCSALRLKVITMLMSLESCKYHFCCPVPGVNNYKTSRMCPFGLMTTSRTQ